MSAVAETRTLQVKISAEVMREAKAAAALADEDMPTWVEAALKLRIAQNGKKKERK